MHRVEESWSGRRVLVTGAAGFIGSHAVEQSVAAGANVKAFVRYNSRGDCGWLERIDSDTLDEVEIFRGDLANPEAAAGAVEGCDYVLHLGALIPIPYSYRHPREFVSVNVVGTLNVLEACRRHDVARLVHTSTSEVYGTPLLVPIREEHPIHVQSPYAASKAAADQLALSYWRSFGTPVVIARPFNTYGPRQSARAVIPTIITQALERRVIELGSTHTTRDFVYVEDTVAGILAAASTAGLEGEVLNLGTGVETSIASVAARIIRLVGQERDLQTVDERLRPATSEVERLVADATKASLLAGWEPRVSLDEGLQRTVAWFRGSLGTYKPTIYNV